MKKREDHRQKERKQGDYNSETLRSLKNGLHKEFQKEFRDRVDELCVLERKALKRTEILQDAHMQFLKKLGAVVELFDRKQESLMNTTELFHKTNEAIKENVLESERKIKLWIKVCNTVLTITAICGLLIGGTIYVYVKKIKSLRKEITSLEKLRKKTPYIISYPDVLDNDKEKEYVLIKRDSIKEFQRGKKGKLHWFGEIEDKADIIKLED